MQGFRTLIATWVGAVLSPWLVQKFGIALSPDEQLQVVAVAMAAIASAMRFVTKTPFGKAAPAQLRAANIHPELLTIIVNAVIREIVKRRVAAKAQEK